MENRNKPYKTKEWRKVREEVFKLDHGICQRCAGNYRPVLGRRIRRTRAVLVHHHYELNDYPQWKYSIFVNVNGERVRNLWSLCNECHEEIHGRGHSLQGFKNKRKEDEFKTEERWD